MTSLPASLQTVRNLLNRFAVWLLLLAIIWLSWTAARLLWLLFAPPLAPALPLLPLQNNSIANQDYSSVFAIFADPDPVAAVVQPPPNIVLKGVLLAIPEDFSSALLDVNGEVKNYRIGDALKDSGYVLVAVAWNEIVIADATDKQTVIRMPESMPLDQSAMIAGGVSNQRLQNDNMLPNAPLTNQNNIDNPVSAEATDESRSQSPIEEAVTELQENPASYLSRMGVMAGGDSYQVTAAMPANVRNRLGLEPGDKVLTVNGQSVGSSPAQDARVLQQVQQAGEAQIEVQRGDQVITIRQQF